MDLIETPPSSVADQIVGRIFSGELAPGTQLVERTLADELGVSRIPIREALKTLVVQGLLIGGGKGQGVRIREYSHHEIQQLFEYRCILETGGARAAAQARTPSDIACLEVIVDGMEQAPQDYGTPEWAERDHQFHLAVVAASHNERLIRPHELLLREWNYVFYQHPVRLGLGNRYVRPPEEFEEVLEDHRRIAVDIAEGNDDAAEQRIRRHIEVGGQRISRVILEAKLSADRLRSRRRK